MHHSHPEHCGCCNNSHESHKERTVMPRILITFLLMVVLHFLPLAGAAAFLSYLALYLFIGWDTLLQAIRSILKGKVFSETFLMAIATVGVFLLALLTGTGDYPEAVAVMLFFRLGEWFEHRAVGKSRNSIRALMDIRPDTALLETPDGLRTVSPDQVPVGSLIQVRPGDRIPIDGTVEEGSSALNTSALTGESLPRDVQPGDNVESGCVNLTALLRIRTRAAFIDSTASRILNLVDSASSRKTRAEHFIRRFAGIYTPIVCLLALAIALLPPVFTLIFSGHADFLSWLYRALTFLVVSCPCALVISVPLTFYAGIGGASRAGVLVKGSQAMEALARTGTAVFDKTGTLTQGVFSIVEICPNGLAEAELLHFAAHAESSSTHPVSISLRAALGNDLQPGRVSDIREISGHGVTARVDGREVAVGNAKLMAALSIPCNVSRETSTTVHVALDGRYAGCIRLADTLKPHSALALNQLQHMGIGKTVMLTGDSAAAAAETTAKLPLARVEAGLLPEDKVRITEELLLEKKPGTTLLFAGDGINDAPVLTRADVGLAMGGIGSDAAIEAADVVILQDDPLQIPAAIRIARRTMAIVRQNIILSLAFKFLSLLLSALGLAGMTLAIFADVGVMVLCVLNATRAMHQGH